MKRLELGSIVESRPLDIVDEGFRRGVFVENHRMVPEVFPNYHVELDGLTRAAVAAPGSQPRGRRHFSRPRRGLARDQRGSPTSPRQQPEPDGGANPVDGAHECPCRGGRMIIIETFEGVLPARPTAPCRITN
jgi:hypothetical protein